jgi:hypothetical protein
LPSIKGIFTNFPLAARGLGKSQAALMNSIAMMNKKLKGNLPYKDDQAPSLELAQKSKPVDLPKWDILYQTGKVPSWGVVYKAAMNICNAFPLCLPFWILGLQVLIIEIQCHYHHNDQ